MSRPPDRSQPAQTPSRPSGARAPVRPVADSPPPRRTWGHPSGAVLRSTTERIDREALRTALREAHPALHPDVREHGDDDGGTDAAEDDADFFNVTLGGIRIGCYSIPVPTPDLDGVIGTTPRDRAALPAALGGHQSHLICLADAGPDQGIAATAHLFRLTAALAGQGALGLIQVDAQQCFRMAEIRKYLIPEVLDQLTGPMFQYIWCNAVPFHSGNGAWVASRGFAVAGVPDMVMWVRNAAEMRSAGQMLPHLFDYVRGGTRLLHGQTLQLDERSPTYRIGPVTELHDLLCGPVETLAFTPVG